MSGLGPPWRVVRTGGVLVPGFSKRFAATHGTTYLWGMPIGRFRILDAPGGATQLVYVRWPIVDVLHGDPRSGAAAIDASGCIRLPRRRRARFCRFRLELRTSD